MTLSYPETDSNPETGSSEEESLDNGIDLVAQYDFRGHQEMRCTLIIIFITDSYIHVLETLGTSRCMASFDSEDFASLSNELLIFNKSY